MKALPPRICVPVCVGRADGGIRLPCGDASGVASRRAPVYVDGELARPHPLPSPSSLVPRWEKGACRRTREEVQRRFHRRNIVARS